MKNKIRIKVEIVAILESELDIPDMVDEFSGNCLYELPSTKEVKVTDKEWRNTEVLERLTSRHVCGLMGFNPMLGDICPGCEDRGT